MVDTNHSEEIENIKIQLRLMKRSGKTRFGGFGEDIFAAAVLSEERRIAKLHRGGADFLVDDELRVDVKTQLKLDSQKVGRPRKVSLSQQIENTSYAYVLLYNDHISIHWQSQGGFPGELQKPWEFAIGCWDNPPPLDIAITEELNETKGRVEELQLWFDRHYPKAKTAIRYRTNRQSEKNMANRRVPWGPEAFYQEPGNLHLVVLIRFSQGMDYEVHAYPMSQQNLIQFHPKPVGPNKKGRKTYDPKELPPQFRFENIEHFKRDFFTRFPPNKNGIPID